MRNLYQEILSQDWNRAPKNPTQTRWTRFLQTAGGEVESDHTRMKQDFAGMTKDILKTEYTDILETRQ